jgi:hypothetical protein
MDNQNNAAKFAFYYMLSLVSLIFMALAVGMMIFNIIDKYIVDVLNQQFYYGYDSGLKFAISSLLIASPVFYFTMREIHKNLFFGALTKDSGIRRWLTYLILFISSVVMIGWLIGVVNSFLDGELSLKFGLKALTAVSIAATVFSFYFYDIKREQIEGVKSKVIEIYLYSSLAIVIVVFAAGIMVVESPKETRNRKLDNALLANFSQIDGAINQYYSNYNKMPESLNELTGVNRLINDLNLIDPETKKPIKYSVTGNMEYELCATFRASNIIKPNEPATFYPEYENWNHEAGDQCLKQKVLFDKGAIPTDKIEAIPVPVQ